MDIDSGAGSELDVSRDMSQGQGEQGGGGTPATVFIAALEGDHCNRNPDPPDIFAFVTAL